MKKKFVVGLTAMLFVILCFALSACGEHTHTPNADDGDCLTAVTCSVCDEVTTAANVHIIDTNWSKDDSQHWKLCTNVGCTKVLVEKANHTQNIDDGDCSTAVTCSVCNEVTTDAIVHTPSANWSKDGSQHWEECTNDNCTKLAVEKTNHTPNIDDGDCLTAITCSVCNIVTTDAIAHIQDANWSKDNNQHWKVCTNDKCTKVLVEKTNHTPNPDDGDCSTAIACSVCNEVTTDEIVHTPSANWRKDDSQHWKECTNDNCTKIAVEKTNHTPNIDDGDCTTAITCSVCNEVTTDAIAHIQDTNWSKDKTGHWKACTNDNCTKIAVEKTNHTPNPDDGDCSTAITCSVCNDVTTDAIAHINETSWIIDDNQHWKVCTNNKCTKLAVEKTNHTPKNGSNVCECDNIVDVSIFTITDGNLTNCIPGAYTSITIPNTVTSIGEFAFSGGGGLISITIPDSVTIIGFYAFSGCISLTSIMIPKSVTSIDGSAFHGCNSLTSITVASGNTKYYSAGNCIIDTATKILILGCKNSVIPTDGSVLSIGDRAFDGCYELTSIIIPNSVTSIGDYAFYDCSKLTNLTIGNRVTSIGSTAFRNCSGLTNITIPSSVTDISDLAFSICSGLTSVTIPASVTSISNGAFSDCDVLTIYAETSGILGGWASTWNLSNCPIVWDYKNNEVATDGCIYYIAENGVRYALKDNVATVVGQSTELSGEIDIPSTITYKDKSYSVTSISAYAFANCSGLTSLTVPEGTTKIGEYAFSYCSELANITLPNSITVISNSAFYNCGIVNITYTGTIAQWKAIIKETDWNISTNNYAIICTDGTLTKELS